MRVLAGVHALRLLSLSLSLLLLLLLFVAPSSSATGPRVDGTLAAGAGAGAPSHNDDNNPQPQEQQPVTSTTTTNSGPADDAPPPPLPSPSSSPSSAPPGGENADRPPQDTSTQRRAAVTVLTVEYDGQAQPWTRRHQPPASAAAAAAAAGAGAAGTDGGPAATVSAREPVRITTTTTPTTPTAEDRAAFVERMQATLDTLEARFEAKGTPSTSDERKTIAELKQLIEDAAPLMTADLLQELPELYERFVDAQTLAEDLLEHGDGNGDDDDGGGGTDGEGSAPAHEPSEAYLALEERLHAEGPNDEILGALRALAAETDDLFAHERLAFVEFFEPHATANRDFASAFGHLRVAADAGLSSAAATLAMLSLIDFGHPRRKDVTTAERHESATELLMDLAREQEFMASLVIGYKMFTGAIEGFWKGDRCSNAIRYYHRCAESNVQTIAEQGGERPHDLVRLSEEHVAPGALNEELNEDAVQRLEYFRSVAANPADEQWAEATQRLGETYFFGDDAAGVQPDHQRAAEHFRRAAEGGEPLAQANYGMMLANGVGVAQDNKTAMEYFQRAAAQGSGFAMHGIGVLHLTGAGVPKNETKAVEYFEKAIDLGYVEAHTYLGSAYLNGRGVPRNESLAFEHFTEAAYTESSQSLFNLGIMYYRGAGTPKSCDKALELFRRVAVNPALLADMPFTMDKAYACYQQGDYIRAYLQYRLLAEFGSEEALVNAAFLLEHVGQHIFPLVESDASANSESTTTQGVVSSSPPLWMRSPKTPLEEAFDLYNRAAWLNDSEAVRKTGACFHDGWDGACSQNHTKALEQYTHAANLGDPEAAYNCGAMYTIGDGIPRDLSSARHFFSICSEGEYPANVPCAIALGLLDVTIAMRNATERLLGPLWTSLAV